MPVVHRLVKICEHIIPKTTTLFLLNHHTSVYVIHIFAYILSIICIGDMKRHDNPWNRGRWAQSWNNFATAVPCFCHWGWERQVGPESCIENPGCHVWCHFYKGRLVNCWYCTSLRPQLIPLYIWIWARGTDLNLHRSKRKLVLTLKPIGMVQWCTNWSFKSYSNQYDNINNPGLGCLYEWCWTA